MILYPNSKINLGLQIIEKRSDGFHNLETLFYPIDKGLVDILEIIESNNLKMHQYGIIYDGAPMDNLCIKAYNAIKSRFDIPPVEIHLMKQIPVGAGLGGGSADASFVLKGLNQLFKLGITDNELIKIASTLGSDCPFFILNKPTYAQGRGEILTPFSTASLLDLQQNYRIELVHPNIHISTKEAYAGVCPHEPATSLKRVLDMDIKEWAKYLVNDFEESIFFNHPKLEKMKQDLYRKGAVYASMTGSGSSLFGVFKGG